MSISHSCTCAERFLDGVNVVGVVVVDVDVDVVGAIVAVEENVTMSVVDRKFSQILHGSQA